LIANDLEPFAFGSAATPASLTRAPKVRAPRVAARLATLGMAEAALAIILLFALSKRKGGSTFGASNFKVWHGYLPSRLILGFAFDLRKVYSSDMKLYRGKYLSFFI
jgi:hypothetical protein